MTDIREIIDALKAELKVAKQDIETKEASIKFLEERFGDARKSSTPTVQTSARLPTAREEMIDLNSLVQEQGTKRRTFVDELRDVVRRFGGQEFDISHAEAALKRVGVEVSGKTPRSRISASLSKLHEEGFLVKTFEGGGNVANRFRVRESMTETEVSQLEGTAANKLGKIASGEDAKTQDSI